MEFYQATQQRAAQTVAVADEFLPGLTIGTKTTADLTTMAADLDTLAQARDTALADFDGATNVENQGYLALRKLDLAFPPALESALDDTIAEESALIDLLAPAYAITPRTTDSAVARGRKVESALLKANAYLAALVPPRPAITAGGSPVGDLLALLGAQPTLVQTVEDRAADVSSARSALRTAAVALDRLNKRFYKKLQAEARSNPALADALGQITTENDNLPGTLGIHSVLQGGTDNLHVLVSYEGGTFTDGAQSQLEWMVTSIDQTFTHSVVADPSGNALGPFTVGQTVQLRTRVTNTNGTTTGSTRSLTLLAAVV